MLIITAMYTTLQPGLVSASLISHGEFHIIYSTVFPCKTKNLVNYNKFHNKVGSKARKIQATKQN